MTVNLCFNSSENYCINKSVQVIKQAECIVKQDCSMEKPVLILVSDYPTMAQVNYIDIPAFDRKYFVENVETMTGGRFMVECSVDVLESFKTQILAQNVIVEKSENKRNMYLPDENLMTNVKTKTDIVNFPSGLLENGEFILIGKDVWNGITSGRTFYSDEFSQLITQVDGVDAVYLKNGNVAYYTYNGNIVGTAGSVESAIDSNIGVSRITTEIRQPAELAVNGSTREVTATAGMTKVSTGAKVATTVGKVATGVAAVATGVQLGAIIDSALYNANPEFWDSHNMSSLNPQTWDSLCSTQEGKDVFNFVFGINKDTNETTAYMDENAFAYIAAYMASQGAFESGSGVDLSDQTSLRYPPYTMPLQYNSVSDIQYYTSPGTQNEYYRYFQQNTGNCVCVPVVESDGSVRLCFIGSAPFSVDAYGGFTSSGNYKRERTENASQYIMELHTMVCVLHLAYRQLLYILLVYGIMEKQHITQICYGIMHIYIITAILYKQSKELYHKKMLLFL